MGCAFLGEPDAVVVFPLVIGAVSKQLAVSDSDKRLKLLLVGIFALEVLPGRVESVIRVVYLGLRCLGVAVHCVTVFDRINEGVARLFGVFVQRSEFGAGHVFGDVSQELLQARLVDLFFLFLLFGVCRRGCYGVVVRHIVAFAVVGVRSRDDWFGVRIRLGHVARIPRERPVNEGARDRIVRSRIRIFS